jgi:general secretion pathway protein I
MERCALDKAISKQRGFTLIEMMVALAVFGLAALALLRLIGISVTSEQQIAARTIGQITAQNLAVEWMTDPAPPALGKASGNIVNGGVPMRWQRDVKKTADSRLIRIDVVIVDRLGKPQGRLSFARAST